MEKQAFQEKVKKVAEILGYEVEIPDEQYTNNAELRKDNIIIHIRNGGWQTQNKITISGSYPSDCHGGISYHNLNNPHIGCSQDKSAEQIARDIQRRFLPAYMEDLEKVIETNKKALEYADARYETIKTIADLIGIEPKKDHGNEWSLQIWNQLPGLDKIEVDYYGKRVDLKLELTPEQAVEVLNLLKTFEKVEV